MLLVSCVHVSEREQQEQRELRDIRVAAFADLVESASPAPVLSCLGYVRILGEDPPIWEVADEDPAGVAVLAEHHAPVAPFSACDGEHPSGPDGGSNARTVRIVIDRVDRPDPSAAVVRAGVWSRDRGSTTAARGEGWRLGLARVSGAWQVTERERTWSR
jgi:hypothetical protein